MQDTLKKYFSVRLQSALQFDCTLPLSSPFDMDARSQRQQQQSKRPSYPQVSTQSAPTSPTSSVFQSSSSLYSISSINSAATRQQPTMLQTQQQGGVTAPLPSPTATQPPNYFGSFAQHPSTSTSSEQQQQQQQQRIPPQQPSSGQYVGQRGGSGGAPETAPFLKDFNLVAEAAKRAQIACLTRDFGDVGL